MKKLTLLFISVLLLSACSTTKFDSATKKEPRDISAKNTESETDWKNYKSEEFGISFKYPKDWTLEAGTNSFLDAHLYNVPISDMDSNKCQTDFIGLEIQAGLPKDEGQDFKAFVETLLDGGLGRPSGKLTALDANGKTVYQSEFSGWDSPCQGHGYMIEQDETHYIYVFTGSDKMNEKETQPRVIMDIISSVRVSELKSAE